MPALFLRHGTLNGPLQRGEELGGRRFYALAGEPQLDGEYALARLLQGQAARGWPAVRTELIQKGVELGNLFYHG
jgi:hypothetical protein